MELSKLEKMHGEKDTLKFQGLCHDCGREVNLTSKKLEDGRIRIEAGALYEAPDGRFLKCEDCFGKSRTLTNHRQCEVYSRIVGYLRPISQWNSGKLSEFEMRKTLKV